MKRTVWALVALLALAGCTTYSGTPAGTPGTVAGPATPSPVDCSAVPTERDEPERLDLGIARITLCNDPGHTVQFNFPGPAVPPDALVTDTDRVAEAYNALEEAHRGSMACTADLGPAYRLVVEYPDGRTVQLTGEQFGCRVVGGRVGAPKVLAAFVEALRAQRTTLPAPTPELDPDAVCRSSQSWLPATLADTTRGVLCTGFDQAARGRAIEPDDWAVLRADMLANARPFADADAAMTCPEPTNTALVGVAPAGETFSAQPLCQAWMWLPETDPRATTVTSDIWEPGPDAAEILARAAG